MPRKSITQIANEDRARTAKWRAARALRKVPEARQVDRAVLLSLVQVSRKGGVLMIDEARFAEGLRLAVDLLSRRHDRSESIAAVQDRMGAMAGSSEIRDMQLHKRFEDVG